MSDHVHHGFMPEDTEYIRREELSTRYSYLGVGSMRCPVMVCISLVQIDARRIFKWDRDVFLLALGMRFYLDKNFSRCKFR
jgi:hypothetical protein